MQIYAYHRAKYLFSIYETIILCTGLTFFRNMNIIYEFKCFEIWHDISVVMVILVKGIHIEIL